MGFEELIVGEVMEFVPPVNTAVVELTSAGAVFETEVFVVGKPDGNTFPLTATISVIIGEPSAMHTAAPKEKSTHSAPFPRLSLQLPGCSIVPLQWRIIDEFPEGSPRQYATLPSHNMYGWTGERVWVGITELVLTVKR